MLDRVKDLLGIEGLRLGLVVHGAPRLADGILAGRLTLDSLRDLRVDCLTVALTERYTRGRGDGKLIDAYPLGELTHPTSLRIAAGEQVVVPFDLRFAPRPSPAERFLADRPFGRALTRLGRFTVAARSEFLLVARAEVRSGGLAPTCTLALELA